MYSPNLCTEEKTYIYRALDFTILLKNQSQNVDCTVIRPELPQGSGISLIGGLITCACAILSMHVTPGRDGGTGRRSGLKIRRPLRSWGFDPPSRHQANLLNPWTAEASGDSRRSCGFFRPVGTYKPSTHQLGLVECLVVACILS